MSQNSTSPAIEIENLSFSYNDNLVLSNVNLSIGQREWVCVVGPNGGGKSTLLRLILGLNQPQVGSIRVLGETPVRARRRLGYMPQYTAFDPQFPVTALEIVLMGRAGGRIGRYGKADREAAYHALEEMDVTELADRSFAQLSGGERQRILVARALVSKPEILLLDEPMANVDTVVTERFTEMLHRLNERMAIVMVSHDIGFVSTFVDTAICVNCEVAIHPTSSLTGGMVREIYGADVRMVRHDHRCSPEGHTHV
jgi:zinc transport system ATP-binding protein